MKLRVGQVRQVLSAHRDLNYFALACLVIACARQALTLAPAPASWMVPAGELLYDAGLAIFAGWVFHLFVVVLPEFRQKSVLDRVVAVRMDYLIRFGYELAGPLAKAARTPRVWPLDSDSVLSACRRARSADSTVPGWSTDWNGLIRHLYSRTEVQRTVLRPLYSRLDAPLVELLDAEEEAFTHVHNFGKRKSMVEANLVAYAPYFIKWLETVHALLEYRVASIVSPTPAPDIQDDDWG